MNANQYSSENFNNFYTNDINESRQSGQRQDINPYVATLLAPHLVNGIGYPGGPPDARIAKKTTITYDLTTLSNLNGGLIWMTWHNNSQRAVIYDYLATPGGGLPAGNYFRAILYESEDISANFTKGNLVSGVLTAASSAISGSIFSLAGKWFVGQFDSLTTLFSATPDTLPGGTSVANGQRSSVPISRGVAALALPICRVEPQCFRSPFGSSSSVINMDIMTNYGCSEYITYLGPSGTYGFNSGTNVIWSSQGMAFPVNFFGRMRVWFNLSGAPTSLAGVAIYVNAYGYVSNKDGTGALAVTSTQIYTANNTVPGAGMGETILEFPWIVSYVTISCTGGGYALNSVNTVSITFLDSASDGYSGPSSIISWSGAVAGQQLLFNGCLNYYLTPGPSLTRQVAAYIDDSQSDDLALAHHYLSWMQRQGKCGAYTLDEFESREYVEMATTQVTRTRLRGLATGWGTVVSAVLPTLGRVAQRTVACLKDSAKESFNDYLNGTSSKSGGSASSFKPFSDDSFDMDPEEGAGPGELLSLFGPLEDSEEELSEGAFEEIIATQGREEQLKQMHYVELVNELNKIILPHKRKNSNTVPSTRWLKIPETFKDYVSAPGTKGGNASSFKGINRFLKNRQEYEPMAQAQEFLVDRNQSRLDTIPEWITQEENSSTKVKRNEMSMTGKRLTISATPSPISVSGYFMVIYDTDGEAIGCQAGYSVIMKINPMYRPNLDYQRGNQVNFKKTDAEELMILSTYGGTIYIDERIDKNDWFLLGVLNLSDGDQNDLWVLRVDPVELTDGRSWTWSMLQAAKNMPSFNYYSGEIPEVVPDKILNGHKLKPVKDIHHKISKAPIKGHRSFFAVTGLSDDVVSGLYQVAANRLSSVPEITTPPTLPILSQNLTCGMNPFNFCSSIEQADINLLFCREKMNSVAPDVRYMEGVDQDIILSGQGLEWLRSKLDPATFKLLDIRDGRVTGVKVNQGHMQALGSYARSYALSTGQGEGLLPSKNRKKAGAVPRTSQVDRYSESSTGNIEILLSDLRNVLNKFNMMTHAPDPKYAAYPGKLVDFFKGDTQPISYLRAAKQYIDSHPPARQAMRNLMMGREPNIEESKSAPKMAVPKYKASAFVAPMDEDVSTADFAI